MNEKPALVCLTRRHFIGVFARAGDGVSLPRRFDEVAKARLVVGSLCILCLTLVFALKAAMLFGEAVV